MDQPVATTQPRWGSDIGQRIDEQAIASLKRGVPYLLDVVVEGGYASPMAGHVVPATR